MSTAMRARTHAHAPAVAGGWRRAWPALRRVGIVVFFIAVVSLLVWQARRIEWGQVWGALRGYGTPTLLAAVALAALSHTLYSCFDLVGRHYVGHAVHARHVMRAAFVSYAFNLNMGTLVGAVGMRMRLYSRLGLDAADIARIVGLSLVTNWSGYLLLAGSVFASGLVDLPEQWRIGNDALQVLGFVLIAAAAGYVGLCHGSGTRSWTVRGHEIMLPGPGVAAVQIMLSMVNWSLMAALVWLLLRSQGDAPPGYGAVLATLMVGCVAGVLAKVPAGLGVLEAVFIAMLGHRLAEHQLLAGLLVYRAVYYLLPLVVAAVTYAVLEWRTRHPRKRAA